MQFKLSLASVALCLVGGNALVHPGSSSTSYGINKRQDDCLTAKESQTLAEDFAWLVASWNVNTTYSEALLNATYAENLHDWSDSIRVMESAGCTNGPEPLANSRAEFAVDQATLEPFEFDVLKVWHSCDEVTFLWQHPNSAGHRVRGIVLLETGWERGASEGNRGGGDKRLVKTVYSEFNTVSWFTNTGVFTPANCTGHAPPLQS
ncbi:uncharacterized protein B0H64DRAFT_435476 [Chaetomium fimeti]|uniref:NTF2-like domain-containing protein n=1 Tax=Chaetomium fimeti TaxID=1854472 RepID=A0AAE0H8B6_9PEZI|nr:hypothetical protein B0H64DRAFT_435476 [Chaetomium fimeti]